MEHEPVLERIATRLARRRRGEVPLEGLRPAAVTVPLVATEAGLAALLTVRTAHVEQHKGEISFPGGRVDPEDPDLISAALRETWEEVGIRPEDLRLVGVLDDFISVTGYRVTPHVVYLGVPDYAFERHPREVAEILLIPTAHLLDRSNYGSVDRPGAPHRIHHFTWGPYVVWGLTAAILKRLLDIAFDFSGSP